jgi:hypothetical protein
VFAAGNEVDFDMGIIRETTFGNSGAMRELSANTTDDCSSSSIGGSREIHELAPVGGCPSHRVPPGPLAESALWIAASRSFHETSPIWLNWGESQRRDYGHLREKSTGSPRGRVATIRQHARQRATYHPD